MYSKKYKLPKSQWVKGRSKFVFIRLNEGQTNNVLKPVKIKAIKPIKQLNWLEKLYAFSRRIFAKIKKRPAAARP